MKEVACIGAGMTVFQRRLKETGKELSFLATKMALEEAGISKRDIDMVVMGSAPDAFDGIHQTRFITHHVSTSAFVNRNITNVIGSL